MLNHVVLMGRLTAEPDYRTTQSGVALARFTLAVERDYQQNGERQTDFIDITTWRSTADFVSKYFRKGQLVVVHGSIQTGSYTDNDGNKRKSWNVQAQHVYFAEGKRDSEPQSAPSYTTQPQSNSVSTSSAYTSPSYDNYSDFTPVGDDDLPF